MVWCHFWENSSLGISWNNWVKHRDNWCHQWWFQVFPFSLTVDTQDPLGTTDFLSPVSIWPFKWSGWGGVPTSPPHHFTELKWPREVLFASFHSNNAPVASNVLCLTWHATLHLHSSKLWHGELIISSSVRKWKEVDSIFMNKHTKRLDLHFW